MENNGFGDGFRQKLLAPLTHAHEVKLGFCWSNADNPMKKNTFYNEFIPHM
jgi:hypothetical protein